MFSICAIVNNFLSSYLYLSISMSISYRYHTEYLITFPLHCSTFLKTNINNIERTI